MAKSFILRWPDPTDLNSIEWIVFDDEAKSIITGPEKMSIELAASRLKGLNGVVCVPSIDVVLTQLVLPQASQARLLQAVPFVLEDKLADDLEHLHFVLSSTLIDETHYSAAVIAHDKMRAWLAVLNEHQIVPHQFVPEVLALPWQDEREWTLWCGQRYALLRQGPYAGFAMETALIPLMLTKAIDAKEQDKPERLHVYGCHTSSTEISQWCTQQKITLSLSENEDSLLNLAPQGIAVTRDWNLLTEQYRPSLPVTQIKRLWVGIAALGILWLGVILGGYAYQSYRLNQQYDHYQTEVAALYARIFPDAQTVNNARALVNRELEQVSLGSAEAFLPLLAVVGDLIAENDDITLNTLDYRTGQITVGIQITRFADLETLVDALMFQGLIVEQDLAVSRGDRVEARLIIREPS